MAVEPAYPAREERLRFLERKCFGCGICAEFMEVFMRIILDVMGADKPAAELVRGAVLAKNEYQTETVLVGNERIIREALAALEVPAGEFEIVHSDDVITMEDSPMSVFQTHKDCSMAKTLKLVAEGKGDAAVSAGNTGAYFTGATLIVRRIHGIRRAALGTILPFASPLMMLDCGANVTVTPDYLAQFACLGSVYMEKVCGVKQPRVGLVNNGSEEHKGTPLYIETYHLLKEMKGIHFVGNVEGKDFPYGKCDVLVCDGFTGNIILKTSEGLCRFLMEKVQEMFRSGMISMLSGALVHGKAKEMKRFFDAREYGGAPFLGLARPVIKAHGSSDADAIKNAIRQAASYAEAGVIEEIERRAADFKVPAGSAGHE